MRRSKEHRHYEEEDATSMGGWLFADSFLALMVIFLATISFVPALGGSVNNASNVGSVGGKNYVKGLNLVYQDFDAAVIAADIAAYEKKEGLSGNSTVAFARIVGGFDSTSETSEQGRFRAILFAAKLKKSMMPAFENTKIDLSSNSQIKKDMVVLRLTLNA